MARAKSKVKSKSQSKSQGGNDALALLKADHKAVRKLFDQFDKMAGGEGDPEERHALATQICAELTVHAQVEEEIFYPALREALDDQALLDEAEVEHASAKDLIEQLESMTPEEELFDAKVTVLGEYIKHHVEEEEGEMFKAVGKGDLDLVALGESMAARREELREELGLDAEEGDEDEEVEEEEEESAEDGEGSEKSRRGSRRTG